MVIMLLKVQKSVRELPTRQRRQLTFCPLKLLLHHQPSSRRHLPTNSVDHRRARIKSLQKLNILISFNLPLLILRTDTELSSGRFRRANLERNEIMNRRPVRRRIYSIPFLRRRRTWSPRCR